MALGGTDLNLLLPLKVLLEEGNVTRAGQRLELSQPAMSAALARLRRRFDDELLVRAGRDYELTPFARDLLPEVQHAVRLMGARAAARGRVRPGDQPAHLPADDERLRDRGRARAAGAAGRARGPRRTAHHRATSARTSRVVRPRPARQRRADRAARLRLPGRVAAAVAGPDGPDRRPRQPAPARRRLTAGRPGRAAARRRRFGPGVLTPVDRVFGELGIERRIALPGLRLPAAAVRHRGHRDGRRRPRDARPHPPARRRPARAWSSRRSDEVVLRRGLLVRRGPALRPGPPVVLRAARRGRAWSWPRPEG